MKNVTFAVDDASLRAARDYAEANATTVDALVSAFLASLASPVPATTAKERASVRRELVELGERTEGRIGEWKWNREDVYADRFSRYEHPGLRRFRERQGI